MREEFFELFKIALPLFTDPGINDCQWMMEGKNFHDLLKKSLKPAAWAAF